MLNTFFFILQFPKVVLIADFLLICLSGVHSYLYVNTFDLLRTASIN